MNLTSKPFFDLTEYFMHIYNEFNHLITTEQVDYKRAFFHFEQIILNIQLDEITPFEGEVFEKKFTFEPLIRFIHSIGLFRSFKR